MLRFAAYETHAECVRLLPSRSSKHIFQNVSHFLQLCIGTKLIERDFWALPFPDKLQQRSREASKESILSETQIVLPPHGEALCCHCGAAFASRNALFKHLAEKCDPLAAKAKEGKETLG